MPACQQRNIAPDLELIIDQMVSAEEGEAELDEGIGEEDGVGLVASLLDRCTTRLPEPDNATSHYTAVCRDLVADTLELS